jgi:hypothetical protein
VQLAQQLMVQHATTHLLPESAAAALQQLQQALTTTSSSSGGAHGVLLAVSHKVAGDLALAQVWMPHMAKPPEASMPCSAIRTACMLAVPRGSFTVIQGCRCSCRAHLNTTRLRD